MLDELVESVTLYRRRPPLLHAYAAPFGLLYGAWFYVWTAVYGLDEHFELGTIVTAAIGLAQVLIVLSCHWSVSIKCFLTCSRVRRAEDAKVVKVVPTANNGSSELVPLRRQKAADGDSRLAFDFQKVQYRYNQESGQFQAVTFAVDSAMSVYQHAKGHSTDEELAAATDEFGSNQMDMVIPAFLELFQERATAPFFVFQVFCVTLWCLDEMWYYSLFTLLMLVTFEATLVRQQLKNMQEIRNMGNKPHPIYVFRNRRWVQISSTSIVAGDLVSIGRSVTDATVPCDLLLLRGPCIVDESMLTGESVPQMKEPIEQLEGDRRLDVVSDGRLHIIFGGTKIVQHSPPSKTEAGTKAPDNGCICYALRTGFQTSQGRLLRTILFGVKRVTANNLETFAFIVFMLIFAVAASSYVWLKGTEDTSRSRYKLFLECTLILTSVVPPELPIELSLAVNTSLLALQKLGVFCTEPFRIPFGGKVDICCFDKTGTLTTDNLVVEGVAGVGGNQSPQPVSELSHETAQVLASCHSLVKLDDDLVGDPLEKACLAHVDWVLTKNDTVIPKKGKQHPLKIFHRFHFSSALKRMSVICGYMTPGSPDTHHLATVKGAPEVLKAMLVAPPDDYDETYQELTRQGARVLALACKPLGQLTHQRVREMKRDEVERDLSFVGFVVISCPLKADSKAMIKEIADSSHRVVMITGDNALTACHVARVLRMTRHKRTLILQPRDPADAAPEWQWTAVDESVHFAEQPDAATFRQLRNTHDLCLTGQAMTRLEESAPKFLRRVLPFVSVFARMAPKQKERIITELRRLGYVTLMCGDGTNDVGALKHANVGVALLSHPVETKAVSEVDNEDIGATGDAATHKADAAKTKNGPVSAPSTSALAPRRRGPPARGRPSEPKPGPRPPQNSAQKRLEQLKKEIEEEEKAQVVRLGDASIAAPFTSKYSSIQSICHVIKQGRCTLVTTLQMFKILALNALVLAYSQSVLYLDGIKFSDTQATVQGLLLAACFLFISRSKPLKSLARQRPLTNIFNFYTLATVTLQFGVHFCSLIYLVDEAHRRSPAREEKFVNLDEKFAPSLLNSTVYIISMALQISTFAVNYRGRPFMESLWENKSMLYSLIASAGWVLALASGAMPDMTVHFELVPFPDDFRNLVMAVLAMDLCACYIIDRVLNFIFGDIRATS